jgi:hypothetical protein
MIKKFILTALILSISITAYGITKPPLGSQVNRGHSLSKGLVGCWLFNEGSGDKVYDLSGDQYTTGTLLSMTPPTDWKGGEDGYALDFDGVNDYVRIGVSDRLYEITINDPRTVVIKTKNNLTAGALDGFFNWQRTAGNAGQICCAYFYDNVDYNGMLVGCNGSTEYSIPTRVIKSYEWHQYIFVFEGASEPIIYIDGVSNWEQKATGLTAFGVGYIQFASGVTSPLYYGNCQIEYCYIYDRALTAQEAFDLFVDPYCFFDRGEWWMTTGVAPTGAPQVIMIF